MLFALDVFFEPAHLVPAIRIVVAIIVIVLGKKNDVHSKKTANTDSFYCPSEYFLDLRSEFRT